MESPIREEKFRFRWLHLLVLFFIPVAFMFQDDRNGCYDSADHKVSRAQESMMQEAIAQVPLPSIIHWTEKRMMKMLYELRDQEQLPTWVYLQNEMTGKLIFLGRGMGYGIPYATQYTSPTNWSTGHPQPEPNGLFMPSSAEGTWVMLVDRRTQKARPVYVEPRVVISPFPLDIGEE